MSTASRFKTLTTRSVLIQEKTETFISDLRRLVHLLEANIDADEERVGIFDPTSSNYPDSTRQLRMRREKLIATLFRLEELR